MRRCLVVIAVNLLFSGAAFAVDMPSRKAGLWELKMAFEGRKVPPQVMRQCVDQATDKLMNANFGGSFQEDCSKRDINNVGGTYVVNSICKFGPATTTTHAVIAGSFDSAYTVDITSTRQGGPVVPGLAPDATTHMTMDVKWVGPCAADQTPGDIIMANGMKINVLKLPKMGGEPRR